LCSWSAYPVGSGLHLRYGDQSSFVLPAQFRGYDDDIPVAFSPDNIQNRSNFSGYRDGVNLPAPDRRVVARDDNVLRLRESGRADQSERHSHQPQEATPCGHGRQLDH
jgi:hypothetical protein